MLPDDVRATLLADRGFADTKLFGFLGELGFDYVIRLKATPSRAVDGTTRPAAEWSARRPARKLRDATSPRRSAQSALSCACTPRT